MIAWEVERGADGMPLRMFWAGRYERAVGRRMGPHIVTRKGWLMAKDVRIILWSIACAERRGRPYDAIDKREPDTMDALEQAGLITDVSPAGEVGHYRLTDAGRREIPAASSTVGRS